MKALLLQVDNFGTVNLVEACRKLGVNRFILISSILVNGAAMGQLLNPAYIFLNVFGLTLVAKLQAEQHIRRSGINYTIVRPGGLRNEPPKGSIVMEPEVIRPRQFVLVSLSTCSSQLEVFITIAPEKIFSGLLGHELTIFKKCFWHIVI